MHRSILTLVLGFMMYISCLGISVASQEDVYTNSSETSLQRYIDKTCKKDCVSSDRLLAAVKTISKELRINPITLLAIVRVESRFMPSAKNTHNGLSAGLAQVQVKWHLEKFRGSDYYNVEDNLRVGAQIYKNCVKKWKGSREDALWCYNGHQNEGKSRYVQPVLKAYAEIRNLGLSYG